MSSSFVKNAIVLGLLSAIGPFAIDMYLPALPAIASPTTRTPLVGALRAFGRTTTMSSAGTIAWR